MADQAQELLKIKQYIEEAKSNLARLSGQLEQLEQQRGNDFGVGTDEEAIQYLGELDDQIEAAAKEISDGVQIIKDELGW